jgi:hypothetical protein
MQLPVWNLLEARSCICQDVFPCGNEDWKDAHGHLASLDQNLLCDLQDLQTAGLPFLLDVSQSCGVVNPPEDIALTQRLGEDAVQEDPQNSTLQNIDTYEGEWLCCPNGLGEGTLGAICRSRFWMRLSGPLGQSGSRAEKQIMNK